MEDLTVSSSGSRERGGTGGRPEGWGDKMGRVGEGAGGEPGARRAQGACGPAVGSLCPSSVMINYTCHTRIRSPFEKIRTFQMKPPVTISTIPTPSPPSPEGTAMIFFSLLILQIHNSTLKEAVLFCGFSLF